MEIDVWPFDTLPPTDLNWYPGDEVNDGGTSISGLVQRDRTDGGPLWRAALVQIPVHERAQILAFQAMQMILAGGVEPIILPRRSGARGVTVPNPNPVGVPHSDGTPFSDGTLYDGTDVNASVTAEALLKDDTISFTMTGGLPLVGGEDFSILHPSVSWRMYRIKRILASAISSTDDDGSVTATYTVQIGPGLREDVTEDTPLEWEDPRCVMRLANPGAFNTALKYNRWGWVDAAFEEAFWK